MVAGCRGERGPEAKNRASCGVSELVNLERRACLVGKLVVAIDLRLSVGVSQLLDELGEGLALLWRARVFGHGDGLRWHASGVCGSLGEGEASDVADADGVEVVALAVGPCHP